MSKQIPADLIKRTPGLALRHSSELWPERHQPGDVGLLMLAVDNALGRAIVSQPDLLLLDEPDTHLDLEGKDFLYNRRRRNALAVAADGV